MFKLEQEPTFEANVPIRMPGGSRKVVRVTYNYLDQPAYQSALEETRGKPLKEFVGKLLCDWKTEPGDDPETGPWEAMSEPFSADALDKMQNKALFALRAMADAYLREALDLPGKI